MGGSPGLVFMGGDSCSKGLEFESRHHILDEHFFINIFVVKFVMCVWKDKNTWKRGRVWPIKNREDVQASYGTKKETVKTFNKNKLSSFRSVLTLVGPFKNESMRWKVEVAFPHFFFYLFRLVSFSMSHNDRWNHSVAIERLSPL